MGNTSHQFLKIIKHKFYLENTFYSYFAIRKYNWISCDISVNTGVFSTSVFENKKDKVEICKTYYLSWSRSGPPLSMEFIVTFGKKATMLSGSLAWFREPMLVTVILIKYKIINNKIKLDLNILQLTLLWK